MGVKSGPNFVRDGLVFAIDLGSTRSWNGTSATVNDLTGNGYNFTSSTRPGFVNPGTTKPYLNYTSGNGEHMDSAINSPFSGDNFAISVNAIVDEDATGSFKGILSQHEQDAMDSMCFVSLNGKFGTDHWSPGGRQLVSAHGSNQIHMVTWTCPSWDEHQTSSLKIYLNGVAQSTESYSVDTVGALVADVFRIGNWQTSRSDMDFDGRIYAVSCYNKELSAAEVLQNYNAYKNRFNI
mgnify:FL=1